MSAFSGIKQLNIRFDLGRHFKNSFNMFFLKDVITLPSQIWLPSFYVNQSESR